ncbi:Tubulin delta chain [Gonapodya sp. JEL0774]|nr:Tubulin delta chain [Gonapodya sp. JEL0774]
MDTTDQIITVCIGQCGNQIGLAFLDALASFYSLSKLRNRSASDGDRCELPSPATRFFRVTPIRQVPKSELGSLGRLETDATPHGARQDESGDDGLSRASVLSKGRMMSGSQKSAFDSHKVVSSSSVPTKANRRGTPSASQSQRSSNPNSFPRDRVPLKSKLQKDTETIGRISSSPTKGNVVSHSPFTARAIVIDTEAKVLRHISERAARTKSWQYADENKKCSAKTGAANNWAFGTFEMVAAAIKTEVQLCTNFSGFLVIQSLAGGTGSGLGSYMTENLRKSYPEALIVNLVVWPFRAGEVIVQNYNIVFSISHLYKVSDTILVLRNDDLHQICCKRLGLDKVSFDDMNHVIAYTLLNIFHTTTPRPVGAIPLVEPSNSGVGPNLVYSKSGHPVAGTLFRALFEHLCKHRAFKMVTVRYTPQVREREVLLKQLSLMQLTDAPIDENLNGTQGTVPHNYTRCVAQVLILRGLPRDDFVDLREMVTQSRYTAWARDPLLPSCPDSNSTALLPDMAQVLEKVYHMYYRNAFIHHYLRFGMTETNVEKAIIFFGKVVTAYRGM